MGSIVWHRAVAAGPANCAYGASVLAASDRLRRLWVTCSIDLPLALFEPRIGGTKVRGTSVLESR
jgi:hypothetical protein